MGRLFGIIYKITNKINGKMYVGQTTQTLKERWRCHLKSGSCRALHNAIKKYGKDNFTIEEVTGCKSMEEMNLREPFYIKLFNTMSPNGYNLTTGGDNYIPSEETKKLLSKSSLGKPKSEEAKKNMSIARTGILLTEEHKKKISESGKIAANKPELISRKKKLGLINLKKKSRYIKEGVRVEQGSLVKSRT